MFKFLVIVLLIFLLATVLTIGDLVNESNKPKIIRYYAFEGSCDLESDSKRLNDFARDNWKVIGITRGNKLCGYSYLLEKEFKDEN